MRPDRWLAEHMSRPGREGSTLVRNRPAGGDYALERGQVGRSANFFTIGRSTVGGSDTIAPTPGDSHG